MSDSSAALRIWSLQPTPQASGGNGTACPRSMAPGPPAPSFESKRLELQQVTPTLTFTETMSVLYKATVQRQC